MKRLGIFKDLSVQTPDTLEPADRWQRRAECAKPKYDPETWFPVGDGPAAVDQADAAKAICYRCPVIDACLNWAMDAHQVNGIWGGLNGRERHNLRRRQARAVAPNVPEVTVQTQARALYDQHTVPVADHRVWQGPCVVRIDSVVYTPKRVAWTAAHGTQATAPLLTTCGHQGCILADHQQLQALGTRDSITEEEVAQCRQDVHDTRSVAVDGGHREWRGSEPITIGGASYTARQLAWVIEHGERPVGVLKVMCDHKGCIVPAHLRDRGAQNECGTRARNTGTTKANTERSAA